MLTLLLLYDILYVLLHLYMNTINSVLSDIFISIYQLVVIFTYNISIESHAFVYIRIYILNYDFFFSLRKHAHALEEFIIIMQNAN